MNMTDIAELRLEIAKACDNWVPEIKIHPKLLEKLLDQLEAERQRADEYRDCIRVLADQLSVNALPQEVIEAVAELKAKLVNPVVLPERKKAGFYVDEEFSNKDLAAIYNCAILELKKKIHSAGFTTVKDGQ